MTSSGHDHLADQTPLLGGERSNGQDSREEGLMKKEDPEGPATLMSCIANLANTILGTGMLAMPHAFASGGLLPGLLTVVWCGATASLGLYFLSRSAREAPHRAASFAALSKLTFPRLSRVFDLAIFLKCYGVSISYLIIIGALMPRVCLSFSRDSPAWVLDRRLWIVLAMCPLSFLAFLRRLDSLKFTSYIALCAVANLVFVVIYKYFDQTGIPTRPPIDLIRLSPKYILSLPVQIFAFTCAQNIFAVFNELQNNTQTRINSVIGTSIGSATVIYEVLGTLGYLTFGYKVKSNIIEMYPHSILVSICQLGIVILVLFSYPLQLHPCRASLDKVLSPPQDSHEPGDDHAAIEIPLGKYIIETAFILLTTFLVSIFVENLETVLGFVGATGSTTISFILPSLFFLKLFQHSVYKHDQWLRFLAYGLLIWGVGVMVVSLSLNLWHAFTTPEHNSLVILGVLGGKGSADTAIVVT